MFSREKKVKCPAGIWTVIYSSSFTGIPSSWIVRFESPAGAPVAGKLVEKGTCWIFPGTEENRLIQTEVRITRKWINTFYSVRVLPDSDVLATMKRDSFL